MSIIIEGLGEYRDAYDAAAAVIECGQCIDSGTDAWTVPETGYIGPMYDTVVTETWRIGDRVVQVEWCFTREETEGREMNDWPWDNGTMAVVVDGDIVQEVSG